MRHPGTLQGAFLRGREQGDDGEVVTFGRVNEAEGVGGTAIALAAEVIIGDRKRAVEHAQDVGVRGGEQALEIILKQREVEGLDRGGRPLIRTGQNRPTHCGDGDRRARQGIFQQPGIKRHLETEADGGTAAGLDIDDGDVQGLIRAADHVKHVGNALAVDGPDPPAQRDLGIERPPHWLPVDGVEARLCAVVAQIGHGGVGRELRHGRVLEDAAGLGQERREGLGCDPVALHQCSTFGREQRQAQVAFAPPAHGGILGQTRGREGALRTAQGGGRRHDCGLAAGGTAGVVVVPSSASV